MFVSLGGDCQPAARIGVLMPRRQQGFFDKIGAPIDRTIALIEAGFKGLMETDQLHPVHVGDRLDRVIDRRWGLHFVHDFPNFAPSTIAAAQARYRLLARWFLQSLDPGEEPGYFVRRWSAYDGPEDESQAIELFECLRARRPDSRLLYLHEDPRRPPRVNGAYRSAYLRPAEDGNWMGDLQAWRSVLSDVGLSLAGDGGFTLPARHRPRFDASPG